MAKPKRIIELGRPDHDVRGPTAERLGKAGDAYVVGGEDRGTRVYHALDTPLDRMYGRLSRRALKSDSQLKRLGAEYAALRKFHRMFIEGGMIGNIGSVDPNRVYAPTPFDRAFLAKNEKQLAMRDTWYFARCVTLTHHQGIVVDNVVCNERSLEVAGYCIGKESKTRAIGAAEAVLREAGYSLARSWRMM